MIDVSVGDTWTLVAPDGLGVGVGAIPSGAEVVVAAVLPPFSPGVQQVDEITVSCEYTFPDFAYDDSGVLVEASNCRRLAFGETDFRLLFFPAGDAE